MKKKKIIIWAFLFITFLGLALRLYFILTKNIFIDEVFYSEIPLKYRLIDIIQSNHRIKDNGFLYYIYLKIFLFFTNNIVWLRLSNLPLYLVSSYFIFRLFNFLKYKYLSLIPIFIYSFLTYFVYMNTMLSTYNLVIFFGILTIYFFFSLLLNDDKNTYISLLFSLVLGFYTNYSFIYIIFILIPLFIYVLIRKKDRIIPFLLILLSGLILILPGLAQILLNYKMVVSTEIISGAYKELNPYYFFCNLSDAILLRNGNIISMLIIGLIILYQGYWVLKKHHYDRVSLIVIITLLSSLIFIFYVNNYISIIFFERAFWFIYLIMIFLITNVFKLLQKKKKYLILIILTTILVVFIFNRFSTKYERRFIPGNVNDFINYKQLLTSLIDERMKLNIKNLVLIDETNNYYPVLKYYFSDLYKNNNNFFIKIKEYRKNVKIYKISYVDDLDRQTLKNDATYVLFNPEPQYIANLLESTKNLRSVVYLLDYKEDDVVFNKIFSYDD